MTALIVLGSLALVIVLIGLIPVGVNASFKEGVFRLNAKISAFKITILPRKKSEGKKPSKPKKEKKAKPKDTEKPKKKWSFDEILGLVKLALRALGRFGRKLRVDLLMFHYRVAGGDPFDAAMQYGYITAALGGVTPLLDRAAAVKKQDLGVEIDFLAEKPVIEGELTLTIRIGGIVAVAAAAGIEYLKLRKTLKQKQAEKGTEERKEQHG